MAWDIEVTDEFEWWYRHLPETEQVQRVNDAIAQLEEHGPALGRPRVAEINISRERYGAGIRNLKELRVGTVRILFAFDRRRVAVLLVGGDKRGDWTGWYDRAIPLAVRLWQEHIAELERDE